MKNAFRGFKAGFTTEWIEKVLELYGDTIVRSSGSPSPRSCSAS